MEKKKTKNKINKKPKGESVGNSKIDLSAVADVTGSIETLTGDLLKMSEENQKLKKQLAKKDVTIKYHKEVAEENKDLQRRLDQAIEDRKIKEGVSDSWMKECAELKKQAEERVRSLHEVIDRLTDQNVTLNEHNRALEKRSVGLVLDYPKLDPEKKYYEPRRVEVSLSGKRRRKLTRLFIGLNKNKICIPDPQGSQKYEKMITKPSHVFLFLLDQVSFPDDQVYSNDKI